MTQMSKDELKREYLAAREALMQELTQSDPQFLPTGHVPNLIRDMITMVGNLASSKAIFHVDIKMQEFRVKNGLKAIPGMDIEIRTINPRDRPPENPYQ